MVFLFISMPLVANSKDRCVSYKQEIRRINYFYWGMNFPYEYAIGQARQESNCRDFIIAFDGGEGIFQFMPNTSKYINNIMHEKNDAMNVSNAIKMNAFYMNKLHKSNPNGKLFMTYMMYNSGTSTILKDIKNSHSFEYRDMKKVCNRKKIKLKNGNILDLCTVGYDYPKRVEFYGLKYREGKEKQEYKFW